MLTDKVEKSDTILNEAKGQIAEIYAAIKSVGFSGRIAESEQKLQAAALERFDDSKKGFSLIKRDYLQDKRIYQLRNGHEREDFQTRLLQKITQAEIPKKLPLIFIKDLIRTGKSKLKKAEIKAQMAIIQKLEDRLSPEARKPT